MICSPKLCGRKLAHVKFISLTVIDNKTRTAASSLVTWYCLGTRLWWRWFPTSLRPSSRRWRTPGKVTVFVTVKKLKGHGNEAEFLGFLQKLVPHRSLTLPFEPFQFWLRIRHWFIKSLKKLVSIGNLVDSPTRRSGSRFSITNISENSKLKSERLETYSVRDLCRTGLCKNPRKSASLPCPFKKFKKYENLPSH